MPADPVKRARPIRFTSTRSKPMSPPSPRRPLLGIGLMLLGIFMFAINDVLGKWLVGTYSVGQLLLLRSIAALLVLFPLLGRLGGGSVRAWPHPRLQLLRIVFSTLEVVAFYWAVVFLPLADVMTFYLAAPIYVVCLAVIFLGERLDRSQMIATALGFLGVLVALNPSIATLTGPALIAVGGSLCFAALMITTRELRGTSDGILVLGQTVGALAFGLVAAPFGWVTPSAVDFVLLSLLGVVAMGAHVCVNRSLKLAPASIVAPYQYTLILWAAVLGYLVFGDLLQARTLVGALLIIGSGLYLASQSRDSSDAKAA